MLTYTRFLRQEGRSKPFQENRVPSFDEYCHVALNEAYPEGEMRFLELDMDEVQCHGGFFVVAVAEGPSTKKTPLLMMLTTKIWVDSHFLAARSS